MNKNLPNVFQNKINKVINNVQNMYYGNDRVNVDDVLNKIYDSGRYIYNISLEIITNTGSSVEKIAARTKDYILTLSNKKINIKDIKNIREI